MSTKTLRREQEALFEVGPEERVQAIDIVVDLVSRLPADDAADLLKLVRELRKATSREEKEAAAEAIKEILDQHPGQVMLMPLPHSAERPDRLKKWISYVGAKVREIRKHSGLTQQELAERAGIPQSHVSKIENGDLSPTRMTLEKIAKAMRRPVGNIDPTD